jgi:hypothetical protein
MKNRIKWNKKNNNKKVKLFSESSGLIPLASNSGTGAYD